MHEFDDKLTFIMDLFFSDIRIFNFLLNSKKCSLSLLKRLLLATKWLAGVISLLVFTDCFEVCGHFAVPMEFFPSRWSFILSLWVLLPLFLRRNHYCSYKQDSGLCCSHDNITHDFLFPFLLAKITRGVNVWMISGLHPNYTFVQAMFTVQQRCNKIFSHCIDE